MTKSFFFSIEINCFDYVKNDFAFVYENFSPNYHIRHVKEQIPWSSTDLKYKYNQMGEMGWI